MQRSRQSSIGPKVRTTLEANVCTHSAFQVLLSHLHPPRRSRNGPLTMQREKEGRPNESPRSDRHTTSTHTFREGTSNTRKEQEVPEECTATEEFTWSKIEENMLTVR